MGNQWGRKSVVYQSVDCLNNSLDSTYSSPPGCTSPQNLRSMMDSAVSFNSYSNLHLDTRLLEPSSIIPWDAKIIKLYGEAKERILDR